MEEQAHEGEEVPLGISDAGVGTGAARQTVVSTLRTGKVLVLRTLGVWVANPHKLFRPENPSLGRFEDAIDALGRWRSREASTAGGAHDRATVSSRGMYNLWRTHGIRQGMLLKFRSMAVNSTMGTVLFGTYDLARNAGEKGSPAPTLSRTAAAAAFAGGLHGALCAPLEVAALRFQAFNPSSSGSSTSSGGVASSSSSSSFGSSLGRKSPPHMWQALTQPLPVSFAPLEVSSTPWRRLGARFRIFSGALLPLGIARDGLGICAFFVTFEGGQVHLQAAWVRHEAVGGDGEGKPGILALGRIGATLLAGGFAGMAYRVVSWPFDRLLVRATARCQFGGSLPKLGAQAREMVRELGLRRALLPPARVIASAFPTSALGLLVYEWLR
mmetsp:Transcript_18667/g.52119  ORF Transcript_18667/g.52119 Transcript_18667/m.52119 type:complete len:385 (-) Transcript_18667:34-1188(-)